MIGEDRPIERAELNRCAASGFNGNYNGGPASAMRCRVSLPHRSCNPYPSHLVQRLTLGDGTAVTIRPIRPEDAGLEQEFVRNLSDSVSARASTTAILM